MCDVVRKNIFGLVSSLAACSVSSVILLTACNSKESNQTSDPSKIGTASGSDAAVIQTLQERVKVLEAKTAELQLKVDTQFAGPAATANANSTSANSTSASLANTTSANTAATNSTAAGTAKGAVVAAFIDIGDYPNSADMAKMQALNIFEPITTKFEPQKPATRREFVKWLVKSANILLTRAKLPDKCIRMAREAKSSFTDIKDTDPDLPLIEGLLNAGIAVGYEDQTFKPEQPITRAEMFALKGALDEIVSYGKANVEAAAGDWFYTGTYSDYKLVPRSLAGGMRLAFNSGEIGRVYGTLRMIKPNEKVTRAEAALCVSSLGAQHEMSISKLN